MSLEKYATARQKEYLKAVKEHGSQKAAAAALGVRADTLRKSITSLKTKAKTVSWNYDTVFASSHSLS